MQTNDFFLLFLESLVFVCIFFLSVVRLAPNPTSSTASASSLQRAFGELVPREIHGPQRCDPERSRGSSAPQGQDALVAQDRRQGYEVSFLFFSEGGAGEEKARKSRESAKEKQERGEKEKVSPATAETGAEGGAVITLVLMTSAGVVKSEAIAPAQPPVVGVALKREREREREREEKERK
jgi:hypothetical protein